MPVKARDLDNLVIAAPFVASAQHLDRDGRQINHARRHMKAVKSRDHEEGRAELLGAPGVAPWPYAFMDQLRPFKGLHAHEGRAEKGGGEHQSRSEENTSELQS